MNLEGKTMNTITHVPQLVSAWYSTVQPGTILVFVSLLVRDTDEEWTPVRESIAGYREVHREEITEPYMPGGRALFLEYVCE